MKRRLNDARDDQPCHKARGPAGRPKGVELPLQILVNLLSVHILPHLFDGLPLTQVVSNAANLVKALHPWNTGGSIARCIFAIACDVVERAHLARFLSAVGSPSHTTLTSPAPTETNGDWLRVLVNCPSTIAMETYSDLRRALRGQHSVVLTSGCDPGEHIQPGMQAAVVRKVANALGRRGKDTYLVNNRSRFSRLEQLHRTLAGVAVDEEYRDGCVYLGFARIVVAPAIPRFLTDQCHIYDSHSTGNRYPLYFHFRGGSGGRVQLHSVLALHTMIAAHLRNFPGLWVIGPWFHLPVSALFAPVMAPVGRGDYGRPGEDVYRALADNPHMRTDMAEVQHLQGWFGSNPAFSKDPAELAMQLGDDPYNWLGQLGAQVLSSPLVSIGATLVYDRFGLIPSVAVAIRITARGTQPKPFAVRRNPYIPTDKEGALLRYMTEDLNKESDLKTYQQLCKQ